jgi:nicotinate-nucleotide pyrophosphorylase (carboxylating)
VSAAENPLPVFDRPSAVEPGLDPAWVARTVAVALDEDLGPAPGRDVTTQATIPPSGTGTADLVPSARGQVLASISGRTQVLLVAERTMLNLASRASGVATAAAAWTRALAGTGARVLDTRKTTPGLRALDKYAVRAGGGTNKRMGLYDVAMVKDNHVVAAGSVAAAIAAVRATFPDVLVQVEADTTAQALEALHAGADFLLLDNMPTPVLAETVAAVRAREGRDGVPAHVELEATGNLTLDRAREVAETGVDYLSVGALTHSAPILDLALDLRA